MDKKSMDTVNQEKPLEIELSSDLGKTILHTLNKQAFEENVIGEDLYIKAKRKIDELK